MKILVTGSKGQIGSELVRKGLQYGFLVDPTDKSNLDITDALNVNKYIRRTKPDVVINAAAYTKVDKAEQEKELAFLTNRDGVGHISDVCAEMKIPLLHLSTDYVFDGSNINPYAETDQPNPQCVYGQSKYEGEKAVEALDRYINLRVAWVFGCQGRNFVKSILKLATEKKQLQVIGDQFGSPTWSVDIADVLLSISRKYQQNECVEWGLYHYTGTPSLSWYHFACEIIDQAESSGMLKYRPSLVSITTEEYPSPVIRPRNSTLNCEKLFQSFQIAQKNWKPSLGLVINKLKSI